jgi:plastocyanin
MRRGLAMLGVLALALGLFAVSRPSAHAATTCAKHTKRVVKHVKRHGKRKKVVRFTHYWTCQEAATPAPVPAPAPGAPAPVTTAPPSEPVPPDAGPAPLPEPEANALGVAADDRGGVKSYTLSRQTVRSGQLKVQLQNKGEDKHDMDIQRVGPAGEPLGEVIAVLVTEPEENASTSVTVEPGRYRMWCDLFSHAKEGMEATVTVE